MTADGAIRAAEALGIPATVLLGVEDTLVTEEDEAVQLLRLMSEKRRGTVIRMLREIAGMWLGLRARGRNPSGDER